MPDLHRLLKRALPSRLYSRLVGRLSPQLASISTKLNIEDYNQVPLDALLTHYYRIWDLMHRRINAEHPNLKLRKNGVMSFYDFVLSRMPKDRPLRVLDLGASDCFLSSNLSSEIHPESRFDCVDMQRPPKLHLNERVRFFNTDVVAVARKGLSAGKVEYDCAIVSGLIGCLKDPDREIVFSFLRNFEEVFLREVPRMTNLIDAFCHDSLSRYTLWYNNFTEAGLKAALQRHRMQILAFQHEYDMYAHLRPLPQEREEPLLEESVAAELTRV